MFLSGILEVPRGFQGQVLASSIRELCFQGVLCLSPALPQMPASGFAYISEKCAKTCEWVTGVLEILF